MINSHKELISEIKNFVDKFDLINGFTYVKDDYLLAEEMRNNESRMLVVGLDSPEINDTDYNLSMTYHFIIAEETIYNEQSIIEAETTNLDCISALGDYLNYIADAPIEFSSLDFNNESNGENVFSSLSGSFTFVIKRKPSYWKKMEAYSV